jgi:hypothetical protein
MNQMITKTMALLALGGVSSCASDEAEKQQRANIILIMSDDQVGAITFKCSHAKNNIN